MSAKGDDDGPRVYIPPSREEIAGSFQWTNRNARDWSKIKFRELFKDQQFDTNAGVCKITDIDKCEGDAYAVRNQGYSAVYDWTIKLKWQGRPKEAQELAVTGTIEISNFSSSSSANDLKIQLQTDIRRPESDRLMAAFRSVVIPRLRGHLENYVYFLLDVLRAPSRTSAPAKPKPHVWLKTNQPDVAESETSNSQAPSHIDIFQEREGAGGMRVGRDFQSKIPPLLSLEDRQSPQENNDKALLVWSPPVHMSEEEIERYLEISRDKYQYSGEQALGLLFWHRYDVEKSLQDLGNFTPHPEEWTVEDKVLFEQAFQFHGKAFDRIRQMLPDKSMSNLIRYYYKWKKFKNKTSVMDRQAKKFSQEDGEEAPLGATNNNNNKHSTSAAGGPTYKTSSHHGNGSSDVESDEVIELEEDEFYE
ncbi:REST corepressor [Folsomia candida]|uniref:REST corepressor n=1 Tax=Folsomia candida TaxID=158441 RepID=A0A226EVA1_FOLCA|nr:REST corepressor [Folsomia candida]